MGPFSIIGIVAFVVILIGLLCYVLHIAKVNAKEQDEQEKQNQLLSKNKNIQKPTENTKNKKSNILVKTFKEPQTSTILKGVAGELVFSLVGITIWVLMYQIGYIVGLFGVFVMGLVLMGWKWFKKQKLPRAAFYGAGIICTFAIIVAEVLALVIDVMVKQGVNFIDAFTHTFSWFVEGNIGLTILLDIGIGFLTAGLTMVGFILYQRYNLVYRKQKNIKWDICIIS